MSSPQTPIAIQVPRTPRPNQMIRQVVPQLPVHNLIRGQGFFFDGQRRLMSVVRSLDEELAQTQEEDRTWYYLRDRGDANLSSFPMDDASDPT